MSDSVYYGMNIVYAIYWSFYNIYCLWNTHLLTEYVFDIFLYCLCFLLGIIMSFFVLYDCYHLWKVRF